MPLIDLTGQTFGRWEVIALADRSTWKTTNQPYWTCRCSGCGSVHTVNGQSLRLGISAGCIDCRNRHPPNLTHGHARDGGHTSEYNAWLNMKQRCSNPRHPEYRRYGARGITVCAEWSASFAAFLRDMGPKPSPRLSLDRIENDGDYEPGNCRWATKDQQNANRRPWGSSRT